MSSFRLWAWLCSFSCVILGASLLASCEAESLPQRCGARLESDKQCGDRVVQPKAGRDAPRDADGGMAHASTQDEPRTKDRRDAGAGHTNDDDFASFPQCAGPTRYFSPGGCQGTGWTGSPLHVAIRITAACYRPCAQAFDPACGTGATRCGRATISPLACSGAGCAPICAETWLCLPRELFQENAEDAGWSFEDDSDAGWSFENDYDAG